MKYLVFCPCGHSLEAHVAEGCTGDHAMCACRADQAEALNAAIDQARSDAVAVWRRPDEPVEAEIA